MRGNKTDTMRIGITAIILVEQAYLHIPVGVLDPLSSCVGVPPDENRRPRGKEDENNVLVIQCQVSIIRWSQGKSQRSNASCPH